MPDPLMFAMPFSLEPDRPEPKPRPLMEAQADRLLRCFGAREERSDLRPGDLCVEKQGLEAMTLPHRGKTLLVLVRHLDPMSRRDEMLLEARFRSQNSADPDADCIVAWIDSDGDLCCFLHKASCLRRWTGEDQPEPVTGPLVETGPMGAPATLDDLPF